MSSNIWAGPYVPCAVGAQSPADTPYDAGTPPDGLVNLTPHAVTVDFGSGFRLTVPSHGVARVDAEEFGGDPLHNTLTLWVPDCLVPKSVNTLHFKDTVTCKLADGTALIIGDDPYFAPVHPEEPGMWKRERGPRVYFIVSLLTALALKGNPNLLVTGELIRDAEGRIIACKGLSRV